MNHKTMDRPHSIINSGPEAKEIESNWEYSGEIKGVVEEWPTKDVVRQTVLPE